MPPDPLAARAFGARFFTLNILTLRTPLDETQLRACVHVPIYIFTQTKRTFNMRALQYMYIYPKMPA